MGWFDGFGAVSAFEDLLDREKQLVLKGDIEGVRRLAHEKERLLKRLGKSRADRETLDRLRIRAERNNQLLQASARGFRSVQEQLRKLSSQNQSLKTYGRDGKQQSVGKPPRDFNKRA